MEDDIETPETPAEELETPPQGEETETPAEDAQTPAEGDDSKPALTLEQAIAEVEKTRREAANYRTRLRDAESKLAEAKTPEQFDAAIQEFRETNAKLERQVTVTRLQSKYELPDALAARLQGDDEAALEADAKALSALVNINSGKPGNLKGGLSPLESDDDFDPVKAAHAAKSRRW